MQRASRLGKPTDPGLLILMSLADGDKHGYGIMKDIEGFAARDGLLATPLLPTLLVIVTGAIAAAVAVLVASQGDGLSGASFASGGALTLVSPTALRALRFRAQASRPAYSPREHEAALDPAYVVSAYVPGSRGTRRPG